jgi:hypothetical protein
MHTGHPRCVTCGLRCGGKDGTGGPICGTNNLTYQSWCHMLQDACATGYVIETKHPGNCTTNSSISSHGTSLITVTQPAGKFIVYFYFFM